MKNEKVKEKLKEKVQKSEIKGDEMMSVLKNLLKSNRVVGICGNRGSGKSSLALIELIKLKEDMTKNNIKFPVYVFGVEESLKPYLKTKGIQFLYNKEDIWGLNIKNAVIYVDEIANFVSTQTRDKETDKFKRFIVRIAHQNCWFILSTAEVGFWNKLACNLINAFIVKEIELDALVNGTWLKRLVMGLERTSDYRVDMPKNTFYVLESNNLTAKCTFEYDKNVDAKANYINPF